ncbi:MAG: Hpt domain-containing protein, partial [Bdellovibrionales bacterium]|nr:Hpt domain-containing protein [Massilia sp.]
MTDFSHAPQFDTGPLGWVMGEIREALGKSGAALNDAAALAGDSQADSLKHAKAYLHQAHGALQMVDVDGVGAMTEVAEQALDRFGDGLLACSADNAKAVGEVYQAVIEYLEELLSGAPQQPARLFPYYRELQEKLGAARIHPADLFFPDLSLAAVLPQHAAAATHPDYAFCRARFEKALLPFLKSTEPASQKMNAQAMQEAIALIAAGQKENPARTFWIAMQCFAELVASGELSSNLYVKQLFGLINLQIRRLSQGEGSLPEAMMRDALFFIAATPQPSVTARALRKAYRVDDVVPANYERKRYGRIDPEALKAAKEALARAKVTWDRLAAESDPLDEAEFAEQMGSIAAASEKLGAPALVKLLGEVVAATSSSVASGRNQTFSLEMATAMLFVEHGLDQVRQLPEDFDAHAHIVGQRLLALAAGQTPPDAPQWQGDLSRQIQQDQTVAVLAAEMKNGLRQVEKVLDDYYADHGKRPTLSQIDPVLHQLQGAVAILDQDDAMRAALHVKEAVRALAAAEGNPELEAASLQNIAQNIGALGFFVDMLAKNFDAAKERFSFDREEGMLREVPFEKPSGETAFEAEPLVIEPVAQAIAEPGAVMDQAPAPATPVVTAPVVLSAPPMPVEGEVEAELLEIFIMEAQEVLELVSSTLPKLKAEPSNQETITVVRRAFHTLKGSGRMVGLNNFGEGAALVEKVMNLWLSEGRSATPDLLALLGWAAADMTAWVDELAASGSSPRTSEALVASAQRMLEGADFTMEAVAPAAAAAMDDTPAAATPAPEETVEPVAEAIELARIDETVDASAPPVDEEAPFDFELDIEQPLDADAHVADEEIIALLPEDDYVAAAPVAPEESSLLEFGQLDDMAGMEDVTAMADAALDSDAGELDADEVIEMTTPVEDKPAAGNVIEFPGNVRSTAPADDNTKRIGELEIPLPLYNIYLAETDEIIRLLQRDFSEWRHEPHRLVTPEALKAAHTLGGTSATVGFSALCEIAHALEMALDTPAPVLRDEERDLLDETVESARLMLQGFALGDIAAPNPDLVARLNALRHRLVEQESAVYVGAESSEVVVLEAPDTLESISGEAVAPQAAEEKAAEPLEVLEQIETRVRASEPAPAELPIEAADPVLDDAFDDEELAPAPAAETMAPDPVIEQIVLPAPVIEIDAQVEQHELEAELISENEAAAAEVAAMGSVISDSAVQQAVAASFADDLDADLLPVFLEEATDLLPELGNGLRKWQSNPADVALAKGLLRILHTVKGSARMAGAMRLGQHTHEIETQIENMVHAGTSTPAAFDELMANYDHALLLFEQLQNPADPAAVAAAAAAVGVTPAGAAQLNVAADDAGAVQTRTPLVRVRADILDRLVNQAGEVSITRSKLENQVSSLKSSLSDFSENLARLRRQLREVEMQAESQISSRMSISSEREFDPLEFDRFTRLQELTRMMAESVNDVASFHESLTRTVDSATDDLTVQSRLTRDLQRDLMRVRMVPFSSLSERLFRVARQTAKEIDKRVNLDIRGGGVEIDRSVLEQMAAPFEHLLRNSIVHGIETRAKRNANGKADIGELLVQVSQQGNEVVIQFNDDGAGLDLDRIRAKARENGLVEKNAVVSDAEAADLIFEPGFSTADALTELAGRGVGMDVVRSEATALGGRVSIVTEKGKGARFTIHLPLTLSVTQVVLTTSGTKTYAVPSILVEQVLQIKEAPLNAAREAGFIEFQGEKVALHFLPTLLGDAEAHPMVQRSCPVLVLKHGSDRLAVQVDNVEGNREVVIKNIGPQLSRMIGIAGATVLGSGEIVLILNPVALSHHIDLHPQLKPAAIAAAQAAPETRARDYVVMVVDDSLTVRKVTQRLLEREGYQVMLAKDGVDALEHLQETVPDLMLVDIEMPRMDGFDLTRNIRGNESTHAVPIIMITSRTADKHRNYALDLG